MKPIQYNEYLVSIVETDGLVLQHQAISSNSASHVFVCFQLFMGWPTWPLCKQQDNC